MTTPRKSGLPVFGASGDVSIDGSNTNLPKMIARKSLVGLRQASLNEAESSTTPKRSSIQRNINEAPLTTQKMKRKLEIGDEVVAEVNGLRYFGVLRHLGPVSFRAGEFAGLELIGGSEGKGKNDGSVDGRQYFACEPNNGMFCPAAKVKVVSNTPATEATPRPQSAMSSRSGRSSVTDDANRPPSVTPGRPRSSMAYSSLPKPTLTPGRPISRTSMGRPSSSLSQTPTAKVPLPRMLPRKSVADGLADEEGRRRAKTSAEEAAKAEGRITEGSRAHQFLNMSAKDLEARRLKGAATPISSISGTSPLKETLLGAHKNAPITPKIRTSVGTSLPTASSLASATPKVSGKGRSSLFGHANKSTTANGKMAPPSAAGPGSPVQRISNALAPPLVSTNSSSTIPRTPSRLSSASGGTNTAVEEDIDKDGAKERNRSLLEAMALLTPAQKTKSISPSFEDIPSMPRDTTSDYDPDNVFSEAGLALMPDDGEIVNGTSQAVVPLSLYEESNLEITHLKTQLAQLHASMQEAAEQAKNAQSIELERAKIKAREEERKETEEERKVEKEDEQRRRKAEIDAKEKAWKEKTDSLQKELRKLQDEHSREKEEHEKAKTDYESRLKDNETLVEKLRSSTSDTNTKSEESIGLIQAKDLELSQLNERLQRLESVREEEKANLLKEIDELKDAGQEALDLYDREQAISNEQIVDLESKMHLLEAKAQEAIADALRERDEALQGMTNGGSKDLSSVAEIGQRSLEEQLNQAQSRTMKLEDQLSEANTIMQQEREEHIKRKDRYNENEQKFKNDKAKLKLHIKQLEEAETEKQIRIDELVEALEESKSALESERSELEALRAEAMIMGEGPDGKDVKALENGRFEVEIERLNGLLEGARSGKREAIRQVEEQRKEIVDLHSLLEDARTHLENDRQNSHKSSANLGVPATNRASLDSQHGSPYIASPIPESESVSPLINGGQSASFSPSMHASKRFSTASTQSRRSYGSGMGGTTISSSEAMAKEMSGLRSIVNTLNQELTEVKVTSKQQERELRSQIENLKNESRRFELLASEQGAKSVDSQGSANVEQQLELETKLRNAEEEIVRLKKKIQSIENTKQEEIEKLNKDIAELEALCEATVWRREEQEARREELERKVGKLQRQLERLQQGGSFDSTNVEGDLQKSKGIGKDDDKHAPSMSNGDNKSVITSSARSQHSRESSEKYATSFSEFSNTQKQAPQPLNEPVLSATAPEPSATLTTCVECNEAGHAIDDCPYLNDDVLF